MSELTGLNKKTSFAGIWMRFGVVAVELPLCDGSAAGIEKDSVMFATDRRESTFFAFLTYG